MQVRCLSPGPIQQWVNHNRAVRNSNLLPSNFMSTTVVNLRDEPYDIYIGRPSLFGNPFEIGKHGSRQDVITKHILWVAGQPNILSALPSLRNKILGCFCKPKICHGDTLCQLLACSDEELRSGDVSFFLSLPEIKTVFGCKEQFPLFL